MRRLSGKDLILLQVLGKAEPNTLTATHLAKELTLSRQNLNRYLNRLEQRGSLQRDKRGFQVYLSITSQGAREVVEAFTTFIPPAPPAQTKRLHALGLKYLNLAHRSPSQASQLYHEHIQAPMTITALNNNRQLNIKADITIKLTTKSLILYAPELYYSRGQPSITVEAEAKAILDAKAEEWEARLGLKLRRSKLDVLYSEILQEHIADEGHPIAKAARENQVVLARHPLDRKARLIADMSKGFRELEAVHRLTAGGDSDRIDEQFNEVLEGRLDLIDLRDTIASQEQRYSRQFEIVEKLTRQVALHLGLMRKIDRKLSQRKIGEFL